MTCSIVVAHFRENLDWIRNISLLDLSNVYIYSKDSTIPKHGVCDLPIVRHKYLPNIGRESHTYITHCIDNYNNLDDFIIFLQGDSMVHGINPKVINSWIEQSKRSDFMYTNNFREYPLNWGLRNGRLDHWYTPTQKSKYNMDDWFKEYITTDHIEKYRIYYNGIFGVSKKLIQSRPIQDYRIILNNELSTINPEAGHYMERSWYYLFNIHKLAKNDSNNTKDGV